MLIDLTAPRIIFGTGNFRVDPDGTLTAVNGNFSGEITSTKGYIANWKIETNKLSTDDGKVYLNSRPTNNEYVFKAGDKFFVAKDGTLTAKSGNFTGTISASTINGSSIKGGSLNIGDGDFIVTSSGKMTAKNANIKGEIAATSGSIGNFTIKNGAIYNAKTSMDDSNNGVYLSSNGIALGAQNSFSVNNRGQVTINGGDLNLYLDQTTVSGTPTHALRFYKYGTSTEVGAMYISSDTVSEPSILLRGTGSRTVSIFSSTTGIQVSAGTIRISTPSSSGTVALTGKELTWNGAALEARFG